MEIRRSRRRGSPADTRAHEAGKLRRFGPADSVEEPSGKSDGVRLGQGSPTNFCRGPF